MTKQDHELYSYLSKNHKIRETLHRFIRTHGMEKLSELLKKWDDSREVPA